MPYQIQVGSQVVEFPDSVGQDEAQRVLAEQFPATGEDISLALQDPTFKPSPEDYAKFEEYAKTRQTDWLDTIAKSVDAAATMIGGALAEGAQGAAANPLNYIEGAAQGTRQLYGLVAQSQDPASPLFKFKDLVAGTGTPESRYQQFLEARDFANTSARLERGEEGLFVPPELTNPEFVQGVSMILDPTLALPGIGEALGAGKLATKAVGRGAQLAGRAVTGVAAPVERLVTGAERIAGEALSVSPEALRTTAATTGIAGALGIAPEAAALAAVPAAVRTTREVGEAISRAGENLMTQPSRIGPLEAIGAAPGANMRQRMLGVIGQYGGDAALDAALRSTAGALEGATIGTVLGGLSGGEEGAAAGLGTGMVQGAAGAIGARGIERLTGKAARDARAGDLGRFIDAQQDPTTKALFERVRDTHGVDAASALMDVEALTKGRFGDVDVLYRSNKDFTDQFGGSARGVQVVQAERPTIVINADIIGRGQGDTPLYTLGHELFHALEKSQQLSTGATEIKDALVGRWIQEGDVTRKLAEGALTDADIEARFNQYRDKLAAGNAEAAADLARYDTIDKKADYIASEIAAEHFARLLAGQKPDALLKGFSGLTRQLMDAALTQNAIKSIANAAASIERTFGIKPTDSVLFPDLKQASPQLNAMLRDLVRARRKLDERILAEDAGPARTLKPQDVANPVAATQLVDLGLAERMPDGSVRSLSDEEIRAREDKDTTTLKTILESLPGARVVDGEIQGRFSPQQLSAIEQSQAVSSRMKDKIRAVASAMDNGNSIFVNYGAATRRVKNRLTGKFSSKYSSGIRLSQREVLPYSFYLSKADNPVAKVIDITKIRGALERLTAPDGSIASGLWDNVDGFMGDLAKYFTNLDAKENARRSSELFGADKARFLGDFVNEQEKGGRKFVRDLRLDRIGSTASMPFRARISEDAIQLSKLRWMPAETIGDKSVINSEEGYRIISGAKHKLYGPDGKLLGIFDTQTQAERKADATQARLQPEVDQQQRPARDEGRQAAEAGRGDRALGRPQGQGEGRQEPGPVRQAGDVRFMPAEEPGESQSLRAGQQFTPEERKAVSIAKKKSLETARKYPEARRLEIQTDRNGNPKFEQVLDAEGNPVLDAKGRPIMEVAFAKLPYDLLESPKLSKNRDRAILQTADLLEGDARKAFNDTAISKGIGWYSRMREFLQQQFGASIEVFGQLLGATSARTPVDTNFRQALEALKLLSTGQYDGLLADFSQYANKVYSDAKSGELLRQWQEKNPGKKPSAFKVDDEIRKQINRFEGIPLRANGKKYNANSQKVLHVLYGLWLDQTVGPKTTNFAGNLTGRTLKATIDVWAARNLRRLLYEGAREKWRLLPEQETGVTDPDFFFAQDVYDVVAKRLGMNADDLQALMWFMEKDVWEKNGWTSTVGAEKSSFDKEAGKLALDRFQAGVTTFTDLSKFKSDIQEKERLALRKSISGLEGLVAARVNNSSGLYGGVFEPSFDIEFSVSKNPDGTTKNISNQISEIIRVASQPGRVQSDVFVSQIVPPTHPNARPIMEVGFKKGASWDDISQAVAAFQDNGIDGFTLARDDRGNVIGIRAQYIPEFSAVYDSMDHLDPQIVNSKMQDWMSRANAASTVLDRIDNVSYKKNGTVSTIVYGLEEYSTARPIEPGTSSLAAELGRRRAIAEQRRQVPGGSDAGQAVEPGAGGLPAPAGDVQPAGVPSQGEVGVQRFMPDQQGFYSKLEEVVTAKIPKIASPQQVLASVDPAKGSGVKPEELKWTGFAQAVERIAKENGGKVPKEKLIEHLKNEGQVKFEEVTFGIQGKSITQEEVDRLERRAQRTQSNADWRAYEDAVLRFENQELGTEAQYSKYQLPGGENYREVVLTSETSAPYTSSHFQGIPFYVAHMRVNERTAEAGKPGLFIEEIQSDRHQQAREQGYREDKGTDWSKVPVYQYKDLVAGGVFPEVRHIEVRDGIYRLVEPDGGVAFVESSLERLKKNYDLSRRIEGVFDAPFRKDWSLQMFKRALRDAVASGKEWIGWTTGETQADRYDLSKQIKTLSIEPLKDETGKFAVYANGNLMQHASRDTLSNVVGKEMAQKALSDIDAGKDAAYSGLDLKIGGEGMKGFYDKILPAEVQKYVKQWGSEVKKSEINTGQGKPTEYANFAAYQKASKQGQQTEIWRVDITPEMRKSVETVGQPRFMPSDAAYLAAVKQGDIQAAQRMVDEAAKAAGLGESRLNNAGNPEVMYHGSGWSAHNVFERGKSPSGGSKPYPGYGLDDIGFWFTSSKNQATEYGSVLKQEGGKRPPERLYNVFLDIKNPLEFADQNDFNDWIDSYARIYAVDETSKSLMKGGRRLVGAVNVNMLLERLKMGKKDGIIIWKGNGDKRFGLKPDESYPTWAIVFDPSQIKSADPITRDDAGNVIPLSKRFQASSEDIRYMPQPDSAMPGAYSFPGGYRALPGKAKGSLRLYGPAGSLIGIAASLDEAQRIIRRKTRQ